ncbi:DUF2283 domain-containing protein [Ignavibacterium sp.]|jgi:uncharacterized protein YuzE|uniref:DUF2283 domain-containing protein n=1 Tax=Ignavibacterium sp. TaxID=2651167 RepID=UPI0021F96282|nr:DUF2283 domain-containing protein [Ignavibacterium sp.]BDQ02163.1 MAG: hypothetical protein KatS3mg037_0738 [Ignavibacterium sp.]
MAEIEIQKTVNEIVEMVSHLIQLPETKMWIDYDKKADTLYISFKRPQKATETEMLSDGILLRYRDNQLVGVTVLEASKR